LPNEALSAPDDAVETVIALVEDPRTAKIRPTPQCGRGIHQELGTASTQ
jgi:hypothetical protein